MNDTLHPFAIFIHFLAQIEQASDRVVWSSCRIRDELRGERRQRMRDAERALFQLLNNANRFLDHLARKHIITTDGADRLASFLLTSARKVARESQGERAWGWVPKHDRRRDAETEWKRAQQPRVRPEIIARWKELYGSRKEASCGKR